jgi:hypothetical protein
MVALSRRSVDVSRALVGALWMSLAGAAMLGCGSGLDLGTVAGRVTKDRQPQPNLWVKFNPKMGGRPSHARTNDSGQFEIQYMDQDGALVGTHEVVIGSGGEVDERGNPLSPAVELLRRDVEVKSGSNEFNFELSDPH